MEQPNLKLNVFDQLGVVAAGFGRNGWWRCGACGGFAGFDSDPSASAVTPWCRNEHCTGHGQQCYSKVHGPVPTDQERDREEFIRQNAVALVHELEGKVARQREEITQLLESKEALQAEIKRVAPFLANHNFPGYSAK